MNINVEFSNKCEGFWTCLEPSEWFQLVAVIIAMIATIISSITVFQQKKQFESMLEEKRIRYRPMYKIDKFDFATTGELLFLLKNDGFQFFIPESVNWSGNMNVNTSYIKGTEVTKKFGRDGTEKFESETLAIILNVPTNLDDEGCFELQGYNIENELISLQSPKLKFKDGDIENHLEVSKQYLK